MIFFLISELGNGGQERQLRYLADDLKRNNEAFQIYVWNYRSEDKYVEELHAREIVPKPLSGSFLNKVLTLRQAIALENPQIVQSFSYYTNFIVFLAAKFNGSAVAIGALQSSYFYEKRNMRRIPFHLSRAFPRYVVSNNVRGKKEMEQDSSLLRKRIFVLENRFDLSCFKAKEHKNRDFVTSCSLSRISSEKRLELMVEAVKKVKERVPNYYHYHAGDGEDRDKIQDYIQQMGLSDTFILKGEVNQVNSFLLDNDFLIHSSESEGLPNAVLEALASGLPVVSTKCGDVERIVRKGFGFLAEVNNLNSLCEAMICMAELPTSARQIMGVKARSYIERHHDIREYHDALLSIYRQILN